MKLNPTSQPRPPKRTKGVQLITRRREQRSRNRLSLIGLLGLLALLIINREEIKLADEVFYLDVLVSSIMALQLGILIWMAYKVFLRRSAKTSATSPLQVTQRWLIIRSWASAGSIFFLSFWLIRWVTDPVQAGEAEFTQRYQPFLQSGSLLAFVAFTMGLRRVYFWWKIFDLTPGRMVTMLYGVTSVVATLFLILPISLKPDTDISLINAFFIAVSALTVTGLTPINVATTFNLFGKGIIMVLMQIGGLGIVVISVSLVLIARQRLSLSHSMMGQQLFDIPSLGNIKKFMKKLLWFTLIAELIGAAWLYFSLPSDTPHRLFQAFFHSISGFCNAGFSTFEGNLEASGIISFKIAIAILIVLGSFGFPVLFEIMARFKKEKVYRVFSANAKLTVLVGLSLLFIGALGMFLSETFDPNIELSVWDRIGQSLFYSVSARTAGFNILPVSSLSYGTQLMLSLLMIIGGAPLSTAGGIKTTTAGVIFFSAVSLLRGHKWVQFGKSEMAPIVVQKAVTIVVLYFTAMFMGILFLVVLEPMDPLSITFEVISALSTVGLSLGVTESIGTTSKLVIIFLMVAGRLGVVTLVYVGIGRVVGQRFRYAKNHFFVG